MVVTISMTECELNVRTRLGLSPKAPLSPLITDYIRVACLFGFPEESIAFHVGRASRWPSLLKKLLKKYPNLVSPSNTEADLKGCYLLSGHGPAFLKMVGDYVAATQRYPKEATELRAARDAADQDEREQAWKNVLNNVPTVNDVYFIEELLIEFELCGASTDDLKAQFIEQASAEEKSTKISSGLHSDS